MKSEIKAAGNYICNLLFPRRCPVCDDIVDEPGGLICNKCIDELRKVNDPFCLKCGKPLRNTNNEFCHDCIERQHKFIYGRALFVYDEVLKESIYRFKYGKRQEYGDFYGERMATDFADMIKAVKPDGIIPIPLHKNRFKQRGYNQAEILARKIGDRFSIRVCTNYLIRVQDTKVQKDLDSTLRQNNLKKAFKIASDVVKLNTVIIVDDIYTTGSTIDAAAECLMDAGVENIYFIVLAIGE